MQGDKRSFHSDKWEFEALIQENFNWDGKIRQIKETVQDSNIQVFTNVSCPHKNVYTVHH
jgi:hypothetical protein